MKKIVAMVSEDVMEGVVEMLVAQGIDGMTVMRTESDGTSGGDPARTHRVRVEVVVESHHADRVIEQVEAILDSTLVAPGAVTIEDVEAVVHIRSGHVLT